MTGREATSKMAVAFPRHPMWNKVSRRKPGDAVWRELVLASFEGRRGRVAGSTQLDVSNMFDRVKHRKLALAAEWAGFPMWLLRATLAACRWATQSGPQPELCRKRDMAQAARVLALHLAHTLNRVRKRPMVLYLPVSLGRRRTMSSANIGVHCPRALQARNNEQMDSNSSTDRSRSCHGCKPSTVVVPLRKPPEGSATSPWEIAGGSCSPSWRTASSLAAAWPSPAQMRTHPSLWARTMSLRSADVSPGSSSPALTCSRLATATRFTNLKAAAAPPLQASTTQSSHSGCLRAPSNLL
jgi:hypothetical protein